MTEVQFEDGGPVVSTRQFENKDPYLISLLLSTGLVEDSKQAGYLLTGFAILGILIAIVVLWNLGSAPAGPAEIPPEVLMQMRT